LEENIAAPTYPDPQVHEQELKCLERCMDKLSPGDHDAVVDIMKDKDMTRSSCGNVWLTDSGE